MVQLHLLTLPGFSGFSFHVVQNMGKGWVLVVFDSISVRIREGIFSGFKFFNGVLVVDSVI